jgi:hypothetical protein
MLGSEMRDVGRFLLGAVVAAGLAACPGCGGYVLRGKAIAGSVSDMTFVEPDDPRLDEPGVANVRIDVERDPGRLSAKVVASEMTDARGSFTVPIRAFGAGWMDEEWRFIAVVGGYATAMRRLHLTSSDAERRLLVILAPGASDDPRQEDLIEQYERFR